MSTTHRIPGLVLSDHYFRLPLDYSQPEGEQITVFAREVVAAEHEGKDLPWLVYFQGGPGSESPRPLSRSGWIKRAVQEYRVLLLDQRGTGLSSPILTQTLVQRGTPSQQADYLKHFRADNIVRDAEAIRKQLLGPDKPWSILGQSFGGFCVVRYLSASPEGLREAFATGGLPSLTRPAEDVYRATYKRVLTQNQRYYARYPEDAELVREIIAYLSEHNVTLPNGDRLTPRRFQQIGLMLGDSEGFEKIHYLIEGAFIDTPNGREMSYRFLRAIENTHNYDTNPIFSILHEAIYCQEDASNWAAERVRAEYPEFDPHTTGTPYFTGEMIYPWMFEEYSVLRPLKEAADILAAYEGWPKLYDVERLQANTVPCAASVYYDDMYVEFAYSEETIKQIAGIKVWITNEYAHNGLRANGEHVLGRLIDLVRGQL
jgi:Lysophospholipase